VNTNPPTAHPYFEARQAQAQSAFDIANNQQKQGFLTDDEKRMLVRVGIGAGIGLAGIATALIFRHYWRGARARAERQNTFDDDKPASLANRLVMAFDNNGYWGTRVSDVRKVFLEIDSKAEFEQVAKSYKKLQKGEDLASRLEAELTNWERDEMQAILAAKPERTGGALPDANAIYKQWAKRLYNGIYPLEFGFWPNTDEDAIIKVISEIPTQAAYLKVKEAYKAEYTADLNIDLDGEFGYFDDYEWKQEVLSKPKQ